MDDLEVSLGTADESGVGGKDERFRRITAIWIAVLAVMLAIAGLGGENAAETAVYNNILASDTFAWYQAKNVRQTVYELAADELQYVLANERGQLDTQTVIELEARLDDYRATIARYESEPDPVDPSNPLKGEGKRELLNQAFHYQAQRDLALAQDPNFDYAAVLYQIAIVLASVAIVAASRLLVTISGLLGFLATLLAVNGFLSIVTLPL